ncbi:unnamed protein product [Rotaria socialis]|uniref:Uncharacterized protein n=1 Tax=Rotaria socialis TaxID=392032 RepID=A0A820UR32_9BILA|nr:unnamed protein product [Rotaria socialis]CAF4488987.1 unnamed protein product [Rotaria socialis]
MLRSNLRADQNQFYAGQTNVNGYNTEQRRINNQTVSFATPRTTNGRPLENSQFILQPNQANVQFHNKNNTSSQSQAWQTVNGNTYSTTDSILTQALPGTLSTPKGWYSEVVNSSEPAANQVETNLYTDMIETNQDYQNFESSDASPIVYASTDQVNQIVNGASSTKLLPSINVRNMNNSRVDYSNTADNYCSSQEQPTLVTTQQQISTVNVQPELPPEPPVVVRKKLLNDTVTYRQNVSVRYLQPPTPPPPGPIIIREICPPPPPPQSPVQIRQRPAPPPTPPPIVIRDRPPPAPPRLPPQIVEKLLPPQRPPPPRTITEYFAQRPPKPADVIIERWLPYKRTDRRRIFFERAPAPYMPPREPNLIVVHDQAHARVHKEFINGGVIRADPQYYAQQFGAEFDASLIKSKYGHLVDEATHSVPPPPLQQIPPTNIQQYPVSYSGGYQSPSSPLISTIWDQMKSFSPSPQPPSYPYPNSYRYFGQSPEMNHLNSYQSHNDYRNQIGDIRTMADSASLWNRDSYSSYPRPHIPSYQFSSASPLPTKTFQVNSDRELENVLSDLTNGHVPPPFRSN